MHEIDLVVYNSDHSVLESIGLNEPPEGQYFGLNNVYIQTNGEYRLIPQKANYGLLPQHLSNKNLLDRTYIKTEKIETVQGNFRTKFYVKNRCLIPVDAFIEYQFITSKEKALQKHLVGAVNDKPMVLAGIWNKVGINLTFCIVTIPAYGIMLEISNRGRHRMPLILSAANYNNWLDEEPLENFLNERVELKSEKVDWSYKT